MGLFHRDDEPHRRYQMRQKLIGVGDDYWIEDDDGHRVSKVNGKAARKRLDEVATYLKSDAKVSKVLLKGRTDNIGFRRYNKALAKKRTAAVRDYLLARGVTKERITITTTGEKQPLASNQTPQGRALNRSVDVTLSK